MMSAYLLETMEAEEIEDEQRLEDTTFIGGYPRLPAEVELPHCAFCGALQTFFFQVAFPSDHLWADYTLVLFYCTACDYPDDELLIPMFFKREGQILDIPAGFFEEYQSNFRILVFPTKQGQMRQDYEPRVRFYRCDMITVADGYPEAEKPCPPFLGKVGGYPSWERFDNAPTTYAGTVPMHFLMQVEPDFYETVSGATPQMHTNLDDQRVPLEGKYSLFLLSGVYFFGTKEPNQNMVYLVLQH